MIEAVPCPANRGSVNLRDSRYPDDCCMPLRQSGRSSIARVDIDHGLRAAQVESLVRGIESGMKHGSKDVYRVDVVLIGRAPAAHS